MRVLRAPTLSIVLHGSAVAGLLVVSLLGILPLPEGDWRARAEPLKIVIDPPGDGAGSSRPASSPRAGARAPSGPNRNLRQDVEQPRRQLTSPPAEQAARADVPPPSLADEAPVPDAAVQNAGGQPDAATGDTIGGGSGDASSGTGDGGSGDGGGGNGGDGIGGPGTGNAGGPGDGGDVLYLDGTITLPVVIRRVQPVYPPPARMARLEATLRFQVVVDRTGDVIEVTPLKSHPMFEQAAVEALRQWKYRPAMQGGRAVKVYLLVTVEFKLIG